MPIERFEEKQNVIFTEYFFYRTGSGKNLTNRKNKDNVLLRCNTTNYHMHACDNIL